MTWNKYKCLKFSKGNRNDQKLVFGEDYDRGGKKNNRVTTPAPIGSKGTAPVIVKKAGQDYKYKCHPKLCPWVIGDLGK